MSNTTCTVEGCTGRHQAKGYCGKHYNRVLRTGAADGWKPMGRAAWSPQKREQHRRTVEARNTARIEDVEFLLVWDHNAESVAQRAGFPNATAAVRFLYKHDRADLANQLRWFAENVDVYRSTYGAVA